jgi:predicted site-specific integrase-resolvase
MGEALQFPDESYTDEEFCRIFKIDRATSARWRKQKIVGYCKLPNGQIRYKREHVQELWDRTETRAAA